MPTILGHSVRGVPLQLGAPYNEKFLRNSFGGWVLACSNGLAIQKLVPGQTVPGQKHPGK